MLGTAILMMLAEWRRPGRAWPKVRGFYARALALNGLQAVVAFFSGRLWDTQLREMRPFDASGLGPVAGALLGYVVITFIYYWWHRARHEVPALWRWLHQVHHSQQRLEIMTSFYKHPLEVVVNGLLSSSILSLLCGLPAEAAAGFLNLAAAELNRPGSRVDDHVAGAERGVVRAAA